MKLKLIRFFAIVLKYFKIFFEFVTGVTDSPKIKWKWVVLTGSRCKVLTLYRKRVSEFIFQLANERTPARANSLATWQDEKLLKRPNWVILTCYQFIRSIHANVNLFRNFSLGSKLIFFSNWSAWFRKFLDFALGLSKNLTNAFFELPYTTCKVLRLGKITGNSLPSYLS